MLEPIMKGLIEWGYGLIEDMADYVFGDIIDVMTMDMDYFRKAAPIVNDISEIILALGWALLLGNLVFQTLKSMMSGAGFEGEDPKLLFMRTFAFSFLLLASPRICEMCSKMTATVVAYLNIPRSFAFSPPSGLMFSAAGGVSWLIAIIVSIILIIQLIKLFFDIGERYVIACVLTFMAPLAFAMGGSKNTNDIFKGWCRMYGSMNLMLIMNIIFLKLIMNAMVNMWASNIIVWLVFVMALTRVARKIDAHIAKIGLNPAQTSNSVGVRFPGGMTMVVVKSIASLVSKNMGGMKSGLGNGNRSGGDNHNHSRGRYNPGGGVGRPRNSNPPPPNNGGYASPGDAQMNVSVNNQSRTTRVNNNTTTIANKQAGNASSNNNYSNRSNNSFVSDSKSNSQAENSNRKNSGKNTSQSQTRGGKPGGNSGNVTINQTQIQNAAKNAVSMPNTKPNTPHTTDRNRTDSHSSFGSNNGRDAHFSNQPRTQIPSTSPISRDNSGAKFNIAHTADRNSTSAHDSSVSNNVKDSRSFNQSKTQNTAHPPLARDISGVKPNTPHMTERNSTAIHDSSVSNSVRDSHSSNQQRAQNTSRPPLSRNTSGGRTNIPTPPVASVPHSNQSVVNTGGGVQGGVTVNTPAVKTGSNGVTVPAMPQTQGMSRTSGSLRPSDNRSVNNNAVGNSSVNSDSDVHTSNVSSDNGRTDRRSTVIAGGNRVSSNVSGGNTGVSVNNITSVRGDGTVVNNAGASYSEHGGNSHYVANTNMSTTERRVNPEYKFGRYDPAAANRKGKKNYYTKDTEPLKRKGEYKRGESDNGGAAKKRRSEGCSRSSGRRRNN